jgi:hypothetical protein
VSRFQSLSAAQGLARAAKAAVPAIVLACGLAAAAPSQAAQIFLQSDTMNTSRTAHIYGPGGSDQHVYLGPIQFTAYEGTAAVGDSFSILAFCVDIFHDIGLGTLNLKYNDDYDLTTNSKYVGNTPFTGATALSMAQITQVGRLVNYGTLLFDNGPSNTDTVNRLAGLQGAIWQVINPGYSVVSGNSAVNSYIAGYSGANYTSYLADYGPMSQAITFITETNKYGTKSAHQSFAYAAAVPEPATWVAMIAGFGLAGAALRRSRRAALA